MPKRVLLIDDEVINQKLIKNILKIEPLDIIIADNGTQGLNLYMASIGKEPFSLVLLDIVMPDMDGLEVLKKIRKEEKVRGIKYGYGNSIPIIMLTASRESWVDAFDAGCDDYLLKPFKKDQVLNKVKDRLHV